MDKWPDCFDDILQGIVSDIKVEQPQPIDPIPKTPIPKVVRKDE